MILFNEGLPRSGKSHDAVKNHIVPAVKAGRYVVAYVEGLDPEKVGIVAGVGPEVGAELVKVLTRDEAAEVWKYCGKDALVVIDEAQNFWPTGRQPLSPELTRFVAEHGHDGLDILLMGQAIVDVHPTWRRRVSQKVVFVKMEAVGAANRYTWVAYKASSPEKFKETQKGPMLGECYDPSIFECYRSHNEGTENKETYVDPRANLLKSPLFRYGLPLMLAGLVFGGLFLYRALWGGGLVDATTKKTPAAANDAMNVQPAPVGAYPPGAYPPGAYPSRMGPGGQPMKDKDWADRLFERLEGARVVYFNQGGRLSEHSGRMNNIWLQLPGTHGATIISLHALQAAGIEVSYDKTGKDRYIVAKLKDRTALVGEGIKPSESGVFK